MSKRILKPSPMSYMELPMESRILDGLLYNLFKMVVKGSKNAILTCVMNPSHVQAVCVLVEHMNISKYDRITKSIFALDRLTYTGDVHKFQIQAMESIKEIRACKANVTHLILTRLMKQGFNFHFAPPVEIDSMFLFLVISPPVDPVDPL